MRAMLHLILILLAAAGLSRAQEPAGAPPPASQEPRTFAAEELHDLLEPLRALHGLPALGAAIISAGPQGPRVTALGVSGVRAAGDPTPVEAADPWHLGSCTKAMTASLAARLVARGVLAWDLTVAEAFPDLAGGMDPAWRPATLELLLAHRGGAPAAIPADLWARLVRREGTALEQRRLLVASILRTPPEAAPGTRFIYSNAGYAIAGAMLETRTGKAWEELMREEVFEPLGMRGAGFGPPGSASAVDAPRGHRVEGQQPRPVPPGPAADNPPGIGPAGTVHAPLADWARFIAAHLGPSPWLSAESLDRLHNPAGGQDYALGWGVTARPWATGRVLTHRGSNTLWLCVVWAAPDGDFAVLVTGNVAGPEADAALDAVAGALIRKHLAER